MFLSIIIPIYNKEQYLPECLDSVLQQDIPADDYEVLCVNDGSTDQSLSIMNRYKAQYGNLRVYDKVNGGVSSARNLGLEHAHGDYIWFIDPDDLIMKNCLAILRQKCLAGDCDWLVIGSYQFLDGAVTAAQLQGGQLTPDRVNHGSIWNKLIKRDLIEKRHVRFDERMSYAEDALFLHQLGYQPGGQYHSAAIYLYRQNQQSVTSQISRKAILARVDSYVRFAEVIDGELEKDPDDPALADQKFYMLSMALFFVVDLPAGERREKMKELRKKNLFPYTRPVNCTVDQLYQTTRTDMIGKIFNSITVHATTNFGYMQLLLMKKAIALKHRGNVHE